MSWKEDSVLPLIEITNADNPCYPFCLIDVDVRVTPLPPRQLSVRSSRPSTNVAEKSPASTDMAMSLKHTEFSSACSSDGPAGMKIVCKFRCGKMQTNWKNIVGNC